MLFFSSHFQQMLQVTSMIFHDKSMIYLFYMVFSRIFVFCSCRAQNLVENQKTLAENKKKEIFSLRKTHGTGFVQVWDNLIDTKQEHL